MINGMDRNATAATINVVALTQDAVANAIAAAVDGDTVALPVGTIPFTKNLFITKAITLAGAGIDRTILQDELADRTGMIQFQNTLLGKVYRLTGITFRPGTPTALNNNGAVQVTGSTKSFRIDHCKFDQLNAYNITIIESACGVIDNCQFYNHDNNHGVRVWHMTWAGQSWGDGSWATPVAWGSTNAVYIERNIFSNNNTAAGLGDAFSGARLVFRYNSVTNCHFEIHGTESSGRHRGTRSYEIYNNNFVSTSLFLTPIFLRSGTGVIFNNTANNFQAIGVVVDYMSQFPFWDGGGANGTNPWNSNNPAGIFLSGSHAGANGTFYLQTTGTSWSANQWRGYTLINTSIATFNDAPTHPFSEIEGNTANTMTFKSAGNWGTNMVFNAGDRFEIRKVEATLDQVGRSTGDLIQGEKPAPVAWPHQVSEPLFEWNNFLNGINGQISSSYGVIRENRDFFNDTQKPGYVPLVYPHPLAAALDSGGTPVNVPVIAPAPPTGLTVVP
jgi:hypothetical protein